jgi:hypothetical protein
MQSARRDIPTDMRIGMPMRLAQPYSMCTNTGQHMPTVMRPITHTYPPKRMPTPTLLTTTITITIGTRPFLPGPS